MGDPGRGGSGPLDLDRASAWLGARLCLVAPRGRGASKETWSATLDGGPAIVSMSPASATATAHDLGREHRFLSALQRSAVPVPAVLGWCPDGAVAGRPFLVTRLVEGRCLLVDDAAGTDAAALARSAVDVLADLHDVAVERVAGPVPEGSYLERQIRRWQTQLAATPTAGRLGDLAPIADWLHAHRPAHEDRTLVHGDYGFHNLLVAPTRVTAVLDWELATVGDPLVDLAGLLKSWGPGAPVPNPANDAVAGRRGAPGGDVLEARYLARTGRAMGADRRFYDVLGGWRSIGIQEGIHARSGGTRFVTEVPRLVHHVLSMIGAGEEDVGVRDT